MNPGDKVSYQCAGMTTPEHGVIKSMARVPNHAFIRFGHDLNGKLTDLTFCRPGYVSAWLKQGPDGKWRELKQGPDGNWRET
jgi:hypothetical protein